MAQSSSKAIMISPAIKALMSEKGLEILMIEINTILDSKNPVLISAVEGVLSSGSNIPWPKVMQLIQEKLNLSESEAKSSKIILENSMADFLIGIIALLKTIEFIPRKVPLKKFWRYFDQIRTAIKNHDKQKLQLLFADIPHDLNFSNSQTQFWNDVKTTLSIDFLLETPSKNHISVSGIEDCEKEINKAFSSALIVIEELLQKLHLIKDQYEKYLVEVGNIKIEGKVHPVSQGGLILGLDLLMPTYISDCYPFDNHTTEGEVNSEHCFNLKNEDAIKDNSFDLFRIKLVEHIKLWLGTKQHIKISVDILNAIFKHNSEGVIGRSDISSDALKQLFRRKKSHREVIVKSIS